MALAVRCRRWAAARCPPSAAAARTELPPPSPPPPARRYRRRGAPLPRRLSNALYADSAEGPRLFHTAPTRAGGRTRLTARLGSTRLRAPSAASSSSVPRRRLTRPLARPLPASPNTQRRRLPARPLGSAWGFAGRSPPLPTSLSLPPPLAARSSAAISSPPAPSSPRPVSEKKCPLGGHFGTGHTPERQSRVGELRGLPATKMGGGFDGSGEEATIPLLFLGLFAERRYSEAHWALRCLRSLRSPVHAGGAGEAGGRAVPGAAPWAHLSISPPHPRSESCLAPAEERAGCGLSTPQIRPPRNKARSPVHRFQLTHGAAASLLSHGRAQPLPAAGRRAGGFWPGGSHAALWTGDSQSAQRVPPTQCKGGFL